MDDSHPPDIPTTVINFEGATIQVMEEIAKTEIQSLIGIHLERVYWSKHTKDKQLTLGTLVISTNPNSLAKLPKRLAIFGARCILIPKKTKSQARQCQYCWAFHNERYCST